MIEEIKQKIIENKEVFSLGDIKKDKIFVSKFFHGRPYSNKKILFYVSYNNKPVCLFKMSRNNLHNNGIEREISGMIDINNPYKKPNTYVDGLFGDKRFICEEVLFGESACSYVAEKDINFVVDSLFKTKKLKNIKIKDLVRFISDLLIDEDLEINNTINELENKGEDTIYLAHQHGDLTYKNIIISGFGEYYVIDWESYDTRPFWGCDLIHYFTRIDGFSSLSDKDLAEKLKEITDKRGINITIQYIENIILVEKIFELLKKSPKYSEDKISEKIKKIWSL